jgi:RNA polymerase sigma-70 factor, ECF subfamily
MSLQFRDKTNGQNICGLPDCNQAGSVDVSLIAAAKCGDATAFEELIRRHEQRLHRVVQRITHNREDAEDAVQDSLVKAFVHLSEFRGGSEFSTWLTRIAINEALMNLRRNRRKNGVAVGQPRGAEDLYPQIADLGLSPEQAYSLRELQQVLISMVEGLKPISRTVFQLRYLQQLSTSATANFMGLPVSTVKARLHRARLELRKVLEKHFRTQEKLSTATDKKLSRCQSRVYSTVSFGD